jgi:hypothetical protein
MKEEGPSLAKKRSKNIFGGTVSPGVPPAPRETGKSFLVLFFKKEHFLSREARCGS